ncbi:MAG TPA: EamA/RhaT family transporter [Desulfotomaculum sp.]|nr:MAG: hypothetical protein JL56_00915 [Desulfotomaculum sp. BICA1-6]HBX22096.1 EamA/RhaT family transporter [Desulfotomaculum sp.]
MLKEKLPSPYLLLALVPLIWSTNFILGKILVQSLPPFTITAVRFGVASIILMLLLFTRKDIKIPPRSLWPSIIALGITGVFAFNTLVYFGLRYTTTINSTIINAFNPVLVALLAVIWLKEDVSIKRIGGFLISVAGVFVIAIRGSWGIFLSMSFNPGDIIILMATFIWAVYSTLGKKVMTVITPLEATTYASLVGVILLVPAAIWEWRGDVAYHMSWQAAVSLVYLGVFASVIGFLWWNHSIARLGSTVAANFYNLIPVYAIIMAYFFLDERIQAYHLFGGTLVLIGVYIGSGYSLPIAGMVKRIRKE